MTFDEYSTERLAKQGEVHDHGTRLIMGALGVAGEAGEVVEIVKKYIFHGRVMDRAAFIHELGDVLWYVMYCADAIGSSLDEVAKANCDKLDKRYIDGFKVEI